MSVVIDGTNGVTSDASFYGKTPFTGTYTDGIVVDYTTGTGRITVGAADGFKIRNNGTSSPVDLVTVDSSGNVGIGTSSPNLTAAGRIAVDTNGTSSSLYSLSVGGTATGYLYADATLVELAARTNIPLTFATNNTERARIDTSGNLLVGRTSTLLNERLGVTFAAGNTGYTSVVAATTSQSHIVFYNGSVVGTISTNGSLTTYAVSSDYRLKENVVPLVGALDKIAQLRPSVYNYKADPTTQIEGFIAHELQSVVPHAVIGEKDAVDADGNPVYQGVDASFLIPHLVAAMQEQQAIIEQLRADVETLKAK